MEYIATDHIDNKWFYDSGWFIQQRDGVEISRLSLKNFPNPFDVWEGKIKKTESVINRTLSEEEKTQLKPRQYIFQLWEHQNAKLNDKL